MQEEYDILPFNVDNKKNWPWTKPEVNYSSANFPTKKLPKITIVTPSYNQGKYLEETIRSVIFQGYPKLEFIVIDGGSTDQSLEIIKKYSSWITFWKSEADNGQSDALNQGFSISTGDIMGWLNSDDMLTFGSLWILADQYQSKLNWWTGGISQISENGNYIFQDRPSTISLSRGEILHARVIVNQVSTFWTKELWEQAGSFICPLELAMDYELWLRFSKVLPSKPINHTLGILRTHREAKTVKGEGYSAYISECDRVRFTEYKRLRYPWIYRVFLIYFWTRYSMAKYQGWRACIGRRNIPFI